MLRVKLSKGVFGRNQVAVDELLDLGNVDGSSFQYFLVSQLQLQQL